MSRNRRRCHRELEEEHRERAEDHSRRGEDVFRSNARVNVAARSKHAIMTDLKNVPEATRQKLDLLLRKYL